MIPIFDSLTHPTLTGHWSGNKDASLKSLLNIAREAQLARLCVVGLSGIEGYEHKRFFDLTSCHSNLFPVASVHPHQIANINAELNYLHSLGYKAIKLHPRIGCYQIDASDSILNECFKMATELNLIVFLCTYTSSKISLMPEKDPYWELVKLFKRFPTLRCVLLHGGVTRLMQYADLVRFNPNLLLDLSYTLIKFKGSSLDLDIQYLFLTLDQRLCIGTDHPDYTPHDLRLRLKDFEPFTPPEKLSNIYYKNLQHFLGLNV